MWTALVGLLVAGGLSLSVLAEDKPVTDKPVTDKPAVDKTTDKPLDRPTDKPLDKPTDRPLDKPLDKPVDKDRPRDKDRPTDKDKGGTAETPRQPLSIEITVPAEATIEIEGYKTSTGGTVRTFQSQPAQVGKTYHYHITVAYKGKTLNHEFDVSTDKPARINLTDKLVEQIPNPKDKPKDKPSDKPSDRPLDKPSDKPLDKPSDKPLDKPSDKPSTVKVGTKYDKAGYATYIDKENRLWIFKEGSKELDAFKATGTPPEKHATKVGAGPEGMTVKAADETIIEDYNKAK